MHWYSNAIASLVKVENLQRHRSDDRRWVARDNGPEYQRTADGMNVPLSLVCTKASRSAARAAETLVFRRKRNYLIKLRSFTRSVLVAYNADNHNC